MRNRCTNPKNHAYKYYAGRGIKICERWDLFENFLADMGERPEGTSIDRIDNTRDYEPANCRWATPAEQVRNRGCALMTESIASEILGRFEHGEPAESICRRLKLKRHVVRNLIMGSTWLELSRPWIGPLPAAL